MADPTPAFRSEHTLRELRAGLELVQAEVERELGAHGFDEAARFAIRLAIEEAVVNGFRHGNRNDPAKVVFFRTAIDGARAEFEVEDQGPGFDPGAIPDPTEDDNLEIPSGRGVMLIKAYMHEVEYLPPGNRLRMAFRQQVS